ncbi:glycosyltransferase involved in cell wall biosynthesis [Micromonospora kangleipakensis]|uniref:Glycosyltransferase involved in cell wall biosynthesis n=1 Tax=Micromonospora kangleipakensis TaxID=1077942 RepID=A0A4V2GD40_9ACTN|nr:glycosyltransferase family 4 protein [Micromonospora kangleipakensis]RZU74456.1 glycosyltransferase involved in cell wall biosynthesis [Micromonospora kangleipakensis]
MKVALLGPVAWRTPPRHYGPWEQVTGLLADGLAARGVQVTLFATLDSITSATLDGVCPRGYAEDQSMDGRVWEALHVSHALARSAEFDLVHSHLDWLPLAFAEHCHAPLLTTVHGFSGAGILPAYEKGRSSYVSISDADRISGLEYLATVHHGVDLDGLPFTLDPGPGLVAFGRIHPDKGTHAAIEIARRAGRPLTICGIVQDERYFSEQIAPHIDGERVTFHGAVGPRRRGEILGGSTALLHPIAFDEPFGLSVVESMACGTPVVAYGRGSMPEVVDEGVTGLLVQTVEQAVEAVGRVASIDRAGCRARARQRFGADRMITDYLAVYDGIGRPER